MTPFENIAIAGGDTATPISVKKRLALIRAHLPSKTAKVLDCGCGAGTYVHKLREEFSVDAVGIEYLPEKVSIAQNQPKLRKFIHQGDIQQIQFDDSTFDAVLLNEVIEHVPDQELALQEIHRVLRPCGILIIFCPNRLFPFETHGVYLKGTQQKLPPYIPLVPYIPLTLGKLFFDYWARNYWPWELRHLCEKNKFTVSASYYLWQSFENISGQQPWFIRVLLPLFRGMAGFMEKIPYLRQFAASQVLILHKV